jgi:hypothetical protein
MMKGVQSLVGLGDFGREGVAGLVVVDGDEHAIIGFTPQQPDVQAVVDAAV